MENKENPTPPQDWGMADVMALEDREKAPLQTKVFLARGREWSITISTDALDEADEFYAYARETMDAVAEGSELVVQIPGREKPLVIKSPEYINSLNLLARVTVPKKPIDVWAIFGHKVGIAVMEDIFRWVALENRLSAGQASKSLDNARKKSKPRKPRQ